MKRMVIVSLCICAGTLLSLVIRKQDVIAKTYRDGFTYSKLTPEIRMRINGVSYKKNPYISMNDLRYLKVRYYDFNGKVKSGEMIVNKKIASKTVKIFYQLYKMKYPIQRMKLVDDYGAIDRISMEKNNTSAFNFRTIDGTKKLSNHSYGMAIDINPRINPYITSSKILPQNGKVYANRNQKTCKGNYAKYMITKNSEIVKLFKKYGFSWGGDWKHSKDYQHFEF